MDKQLNTQIERQVVEYVLGICNEQKLDFALNLFEHGYLSSLDILDLVAFVEETFEIKISEDDLNMENLGTISSMVRYIGEAMQQQ